MCIPGQEKRTGSSKVNRLSDNTRSTILVVEDDENILNLLTAYRLPLTAYRLPLTSKAQAIRSVPQATVMTGWNWR